MLPRNARIPKIWNNFDRWLNINGISSGEHGSFADRGNGIAGKVNYVPEGFGFIPIIICTCSTQINWVCGRGGGWALDCFVTARSEKQPISTWGRYCMFCGNYRPVRRWIMGQQVQAAVGISLSFSRHTNSMANSPPWQADSHSLCKEIPATLENSKAHIFCFLKINSDTVLLSSEAFYQAQSFLE